MPHPILTTFLIFLLFLGRFVWIMRHDKRSLHTGTSLVFTVFALAIFVATVLLNIADIDPHYKDWILPLFVIVFVLLLVAMAAFALTLIVMFIYNGIKLIKKEGSYWTNYLSLGMGIAIIFFLFLYPQLGKLSRNSWLTYPYLFLWLVIVYLVVIMMIYTLTAWLNLLNWKTKPLDYVVVLGAGILGKKVTPLLAARIKRGIEVYKNNPGSKLIMSGGQGRGEDIAEAEAMAAYAENLGIPESDILVENKSKTTQENLRFSRALMEAGSNFCIVTSSYHVYRALILAKRQGLDCIGYGAKTKWYFTLNAFIREFIAYLVITKKMQLTVIAILALPFVVGALLNLH